MIRSSTVVMVQDMSGVATARRGAQQLAERLQLSATAVGKAGLAATELATNLVKHARGGRILFATDEDQPHALGVLAIDKGPGISNVTGAIRDGFSTAGSPGTGLGAIARAGAFDIWSMEGKGTVVLCRIEDEALRPRLSPSDRAPRIAVAGICVAMAGEDESGDAWTSLHNADDQTTVVVADGLGHGPSAATAAREAVRSVRERPGRELPELMTDAHGALRATRGAAMAVARIHPSRGLVEFAGVGNIAGVVAAEVTRRTVSHGGIVGHEMRKAQTFTYPWSPSSILIMHSDGIGTSWMLESYPGLAQRAPEIIAAILFRDFCRGTDDATVVVAKAV